MRLFQITSNYFCAGFVTKDGHIAHAAPIIRYMIGWDAGKTLSYCRRKGWKLQRV